MKLKQRLTALLLSAGMLLAPAASLAENTYTIPSGEVTTTALSDAYVGGEQINVTASFDLNTLMDSETLADMLDTDVETAEKKLAALTRIIEKCSLELSFYDDFGTARIHGELLMGGTPLLTGTALIAEDGSAQIMTNLTGALVLALPAGTFSSRSFDVMDLLYGGFSAEVDESVPFAELPAKERLRITATDTLVMVVQHLLGWVSGTQMQTGELYTFDDTYLDATDTRDAVAQRMIGKIDTYMFMRLLNNIATTLRDDQGLLQQAIADVLAENGVTRYQVRQVVDSLLKNEEINPAEDWVQLSASIPDDGALCTLDDISYFFKKLHKSTTRMMVDHTDETMSMIVSYDDYGGMVGFDAVVPLINTHWPFEGDFTYSIRTDDDWQRIHTSHGELQIYDNNRLVGDLSLQFGQDVNGLNANHAVGQLDVMNQDTGTAKGVGIVSSLDFTASGTDEAQTEGFEGRAALQLRMNGEGIDVICGSVTGETRTDNGAFTMDADAAVSLAYIVELTAHVNAANAEAEEIAFSGGEAIDVSDPTEEQLQRVRDEVAKQAGALTLTLATKLDVIADVMTLLK